MICKNTIEEKIILMQQNKKELSDDLVGAEENFVKTMSVDDVKFLFGS
jgi:SNF2 family DNA or RNA helicase